MVQLLQMDVKLKPLTSRSSFSKRLNSMDVIQTLPP
jgi:hypothetical protein